jgi:transcription elongation GreA/GreB family factor
MKLPEDIAREVRLREEAERLRGELANSEAERMRLAEKLEKANVLIARCDLAMTVGSMSVSEAIERCREVLPKEKHDDDVSVAVGRTIEFLRGQIGGARETTATLVAAVREFRAAEAACNEAQREFHEANKAYRNLQRESFHPASINDGLRACNEAQSVLDEAQRRMRSASIVLDALTGEGRPGEKPTSEGGQRR